MSIHEPLLFSSRYGCWSCCLCGWTSGGRWTTTTGAHLAFGRHLVTPDRETPSWVGTVLETCIRDVALGCIASHSSVTDEMVAEWHRLNPGRADESAANTS